MGHSICLQDLDFDEVPLVDYSSSGVPFTRWVRAGMPKIPQTIIDSVFYLYASEEDAKAGKDPGGTGFIVSDWIVRGTVGGADARHYYAVTNWHVACQGYPVIRLNRHDGGIDVIDLNPDQWEFLPGKYDVAVFELTLDKDVHKTSDIPTYMFLGFSHGGAFNEIGRTTQGIGVGDDVFMLGLFVDHNGITTNVPSARFGNISMMPSERAKLEQSTGYSGVSFVVDMHSRTGFSGSPVFVYRTFGDDLTTNSLEYSEIEPGRYGRRGGKIKFETVFKFLGIHWAQFPETWELQSKPKMTEAKQKNTLVVDGAMVEGMSGMTCVIPAWQVLEVLDMPKLKQRREAAAAARQQKKGPKPERASPPSTDANPNHREDFTRLLGEAARKPPQED